VTGKFLGNLVTVAGTLGALFSLTYLAMQPLYEGTPSGAEVAGFFGMLGIVVLGSAAYASISLFLSTLSRSTVRSLLLMLALWLVVFPLVGAIGIFSHLGEGDFDFDDPEVQGWLYLNPAADMAAGARLLVPGELQREFLSGMSVANPFALTPNDTGLAILALVAYTVVFFAASILVVRRRNFE
ncbi:MAG TPA: ABC transporter permease subunit, partial [Candidatus Thermoplasmatota archaeon]|nr:ABC transporter permease subunit [Candidatus Thermoplasmatota archaeon]